MIDAMGRTTRYEYDAFGQLVSEVLPGGQRDLRTYDQFGRLITYKDYNSKTRTYEYDANNNVIRIIYSDGSQESFVYDAAGKLLSETNSSGTNTYRYDARDRLTHYQSAIGAAIAYTYDAAGYLLSRTDPVGKTTYSYDAIGQLIQAQFPQGSKVTYEYNPARELIATNLSNGISIDYQLDDLGRVDVVRHTNTNGEIVQEFEYELDATGRAISVSELDGRTTTWMYDDAKRLIREEVSGQPGQNYWVNYQYNAVGSRIREVHSLNGERTFAYDSNDRLTTVTASLGITRYTFDNNGNLIGEVAPSASKSYRWNEQNELIEQTIDALERLPY